MADGSTYIAPTDFAPEEAEAWRGVLLRAADEMDRRGLAKGTQCDAKGRVCLAGALNFVAFGDFSYRNPLQDLEAYQRLQKYLRTLPGDVSHVPGSWHNEPHRTKAECVAALRNCANQGR